MSTLYYNATVVILQNSSNDCVVNYNAIVVIYNTIMTNGEFHFKTFQAFFHLIFIFRRYF